MSAGRWFALSVGLLVVVAVVGTIASVVALDRLSTARVALADRLDPAAIAASDLKAAMADQETGTRGYVLTGDRTFLEPYQRGLAAAADATRRLRSVAGTEALSDLRGRLGTMLVRAGEWRTGYAVPAQRDAVARPDVARGKDALDRGKQSFDAVRAALAAFTGPLTTARLDARARLDDSATTVQRWVIGTGSWTSAPTSTSASRSTARRGCRR